MCIMQYSPENVLSFWFGEIAPLQWWEKSSEFDNMVAQRFGALHKAAACCELYAWRETARGRLAEILVLDQFSRNIYRNQAQAFASDPQALVLAQTAVAVGADRELNVTERPFLYLPFMHSESIAIHSMAMKLLDVPGLEKTLEFERKHKEIIDRFHRYPHRNALLGRESTPEEIEFLQTPGSSF
jgi:uncharacterized protein (DUF924 family)